MPNYCCFLRMSVSPLGSATLRCTCSTLGFCEVSINFARGVLENDISAMGKSHLAFALFSQPRAGKCGKGSRRRAPGPKTQVEERFFSSIGARGSDTTPPAPCVTSSHATSEIAEARWKRVHFFSMIGFSTLYERADTFFRSR